MSDDALGPARRAAGAAAIAGLGALVPVAAWLGYLGWRVSQAWPDSSYTSWTATIAAPAIGRVDIPALLGVVLIVPGPVLVALASVAALRWMRRAPARVPLALGLGAAGGVLATLPGLVISLTWRYVYGLSSAVSGSGGSGLGPAPICGPLYLAVAAVFAWAWVRHAAAWRRGGLGEA